MNNIKSPWGTHFIKCCYVNQLQMFKMITEQFFFRLTRGRFPTGQITFIAFFNEEILKEYDIFSVSSLYHMSLYQLYECTSNDFNLN